MSAPALGEFRSLLALFRQSDLRDLSVSTRDWSVFLAKPGGSPYPDAPAAPPPALAAAPAETVTAEHLGVVAELLPSGSRVAAGDTVAELSVLDERRAVLAKGSGTVGAHLVTTGQLVEYGQALLEIA